MSVFSEVIFDPSFKLSGSMLVEASAGTGKTYNIQNAFLRLVMAAGLPVQNILVVTFTEAATHELRTRLRAILALCRTFLEWRLYNPAGTCPIAEQEDRDRLEKACRVPLTGSNTSDGDQERLARVRLAIMDFDGSAVFTIHGFCKRVLDRYAFECGHDPDAELLPDPGLLLEEICQDWWRERTYTNKSFRAQVPFRNVDEFTRLVHLVFDRPDARIEPSEKTLEAWEDLKQKALASLDSFHTSQDKEWKTWTRNPAAEEFLALLSRIRDALNPGNLPALRILLKDFSKTASEATWSEPQTLPSELYTLREACRTAADLLRTAKTYEGLGTAIRVTKTKTCDISSILSLVRDHTARLRDFNLNARWKENKNAQDMPNALAALLDSYASVTGDAKDFCAAIKTVAKFDPAQMLETIQHLAEDLSPRLMEDMARLRRWIYALMATQLAETAARAHREIQARNALTYTAMLLQVRDALRAPQTGPRLRQVLRAEFRAALVDEFQDTDPVQYDVFQLLFGETQATHPLVFVGDPKQAIYGFRGGDVFTYYGAKEIIRTGEHVPGEARHELDTNFRAEKGLVAAVNELFQDPMSADPAGPPARTSTFLNANIAYDGRLKAHDVTEDRRLTAGGQPAGKPFRIRTYPFTGSRLPGKHSPLAQQMYADVAREIVRLLSDKTLTIGSRHVAPQDIAVLVLDHEEATDIQQELLVRGVNAIRQATGCVFDTDEAIGLAHVMGAMLHPRQPRGVRAALCQPIMPCRDEDIRRFNDETAAAVPGPPDNPAKSEPESDESEPDSEESDEDVARSPKTLDEWMDVLAEAGRRWERRSFIEAFRFLAGRLGLRAHVAGLPDGARRLADLLHLAELAHVSARERQLGPNALWRWFVRQLDPDTREGGEDDAYKTRLASDEPAVRIMTIFKSKGLEFPIVFAPTLWRRQTRNRPGRTSHWQYHDADMRMLISLDPDDADAKNKARQEELEENIRLVYVALTRAINRTYVWALENSASRTSACALDHVLASWKARVPAETQSAHIEVMPADQVSWEGIPERWEPATTPKSLKEPQPPSVDKTHGHASYSSLAVHPKKKKFRIPDDSARDRDNLVVEAQTPEPAEPLPASGIFAIPGNATTGDCWHSIFENLDFQAGPEAMAKVIDDNLDRFRICKGPTPETVADKRRAVHDMVARVLTADLDAGYGRFALRDVPLATRRSELAFHFTMKQRGEAQKLQTLGCILDKHWNTGARDEEFLKNLSMSKKRLPLGFMVGSIDLLFQHDGRFYVVDWKSNWIKGRIENFEPPGLKAEMAANSYYLQYMIYTVAVDGFLQRALAGYDYEKHFGGIFYLFLRGVDARGRGIFTDRPSPKLIRALARFLAQGSGGAL